MSKQNASELTLPQQWVVDRLPEGWFYSTDLIHTHKCHSMCKRLEAKGWLVSRSTYTGPKEFGAWYDWFTSTPPEKRQQYRKKITPGNG